MGCETNSFQLFFGTFDAVVLMASVFILFPRENAEYVTSALQHIQWAIERFETMAERNRLAASARGVLHAIHIRLKKALGISWTHPATAGSPGPASLAAPANKTTPSSTLSASSNTDSQTTAARPSPSLAASSSNGTRGTSTFTPPESVGEPYFGGPGSLSDRAPPIDPGLSGVAASDWSLPEGFDWGSIQPVYAMADVAYNDLMGISSHGASDITTAASMPNWAGGTPLLNEVSSGPGAAGTGGDLQGWSFGGDFGNDSVWSVLNQFGQF